MTMQIVHFPGGGFAVHRALDGKTSGWFDQTGALIDGEFRDALGRACPVRDGGKRWKELVALGARIKASPSGE